MQVLNDPKAINVLGRPDTKGQLPDYPPDHEVGMEVPIGGSNCNKCEYLKAKQTCGQDDYVAWNGGPRIPKPTDRYCCDFFETSGVIDNKPHKAAMKEAKRLDNKQNPEADPELPV